MKVEIEAMQCLHDDVDILEGENTCTCCGTILGSHIDEGAEWRMYSTTEDDPSRTGTITNELLPGSSYGSMMMRKRVPGQSEEAKTIAKLSSWSFSNHGERSWMGIFDAIQGCCTRIGLPKAVILDACSLFKKIEDARKTRGETRRALMAGSVFIACRQHDATRTHEEIASLFHVSIRALCKGLMRFTNEESSVINTQLGIAERICADLVICDKDRDAIMLRLSTLPEMEHTPKTIVAGVIFRVLGGRLQDIITSSGVSSVSIRKVLDKLKS